MRTAARSNRPVRRGTLVAVALALAALTAGGTPAHAQATTPTLPPIERVWSFRIASGSLVSTGSVEQVKTANVTAAQLARHITPHLSLTSSVAWARSRDLTTSAPQKLDVFTSDLGIEGRTSEWRSANTTARMFAGVGGGLRSYAGRSDDANGTHHAAGYLAVGTDLGIRRVGLRLESRGYATRFTPLAGARTARAQRDIAIIGALYLKARRAATAQP